MRARRQLMTSLSTLNRQKERHKMPPTAALIHMAFAYIHRRKVPVNIQSMTYSLSDGGRRQIFTAVAGGSF